MKHNYILVFTMVCILAVLSGCLYPQGDLAKNQPPNEAQLDMVQSAVEQYREMKQGLVPIKTKDNDTPLFQKYLVDFSLLKENNILQEIPGTAYENGGLYQYTLITPEDDPRVKLIDLRITEQIRSVNVKLDIYRNEHIYPPFKQEIEEGIFTIDYEKLGFEKPPHVVSPYSQENLPIIMDVDGNLYVDYRIDLLNALEDHEHTYQEGDDIRFLLAENTPFVPAYSLPYTVRSGEPVFMNDK
jgi:hypothetical protein